MKTTNIVDIDGSQLTTWESFHQYFSDKFGFPSFYGNNMNAWIDCMTDLDSVETKMITKNYVEKDSSIVLNITNIEYLKKKNREIYDALIECSSFVNYRRIEINDSPIIYLSFFQ